MPPNDVEPSILTLRGRKILLDRDLAVIYGTTVGALNQAVKRNKGRFPIDFMFRLSWDETRLVSALRSQNVILKRGGHLKFRPNAFTEHGAVMLAAIFEQPSCRGSIHSSGASICAAAAGSLIARRISSEVGGD